MNGEILERTDRSSKVANVAFYDEIFVDVAEDGLLEVGPQRRRLVVSLAESA